MPKRRTQGSSSVTKLPSGRWRATHASFRVDDPIAEARIRDLLEETADLQGVTR